MVRYKQLCMICRKNKVLMQSYKQKPICLDCQMKQWDKIENEKYRRLFNIPKKFYEESYFLRSVRDYYDRAEKISKKQEQAFKKTVDELKNKK
ncbi:hypothetical protein HYT56_02480 [Candidatus Woesearchaeota archaeon]|nr:hypothetical protein [Candidatus Woesearchaeota archaeon]